MKEWIKVVGMHFFIITVGVMFFTSIEPLFECGFSSELIYPAWYPWMVMLVGIVGAVPTLLFHFKKEPTKKQFFVRTLLHFAVIETLIMVMGYIFKWYTTLSGAVTVFVMILAVYVFVWFFTIKLDYSLADNINEALKKINDDEEE